MDTDEYSFSAFASHRFFTEVNRWIVERVLAQPRRTIVDLGCGPGAVTRLILDRLNGAEGAQVIGVDPSESALEQARRTIISNIVQFLRGSAERLSRLVGSADAVIFCNAIHLIPDKERVLSEIRSVLKPGGVLAFNSTFFSGAYVEGTSGFWRRWIARSMQVLKERGMVVARQEKAMAMQWLSPTDYAALCEAAGFHCGTVELLRVDLPAESLADIGRFSLFIEGALPGVPMDVASDALQEGLRRALDELGVTSVPRYWLECVATAA
jgi:ubiquinone/menaquinone biosynthesis C-methylase UbiE